MVARVRFDVARRGRDPVPARGRQDDVGERFGNGRSSSPTLMISTRRALAISGTAAVTARHVCRLGDHAIIAELLGSDSGRAGDSSTGRPVSSRVCSAICACRRRRARVRHDHHIVGWCARLVTALAYEPSVWRQEADGTGSEGVWRAYRHAVRGAEALELGSGLLGGTFACLRPRARTLPVRAAPTGRCRPPSWPL